MKVFSYLYDKIIELSSHKHAQYYLATISFAESSVFPIPPDVMLISMGLAVPDNAWRYALITTISSVLGGIFGYMIGYFGMEFIHPWLIHSAYHASYLKTVDLFKNYGIWIIFVAGCAPIPYKLFTIAAGILHMAFFPFVLGSILGRGLRFYLVSGILFFKGHSLKNNIRHYVDIVGWSMLLILIVAFLLFKWLH